MAGGERTFKANFSAEGVAALRERIREKLNELMEDYTDDTLVEYVVVLLRNGRRKDEAATELKVFLGKDNDAFVSWLWDHLSSNLQLYVQPKAVSTNDEAKNTRGTARGLPVHNSSSTIRTSREPEAETQKTRVQQKREWGGMVREQPEAATLRSVVAPVSHAEEKAYHKSEATRRTRSPDMHHHRKRGREDDTRPAKRTSQQVISAPRRLLQFAVRDAVRPVQPVTPRSESSSKRLRSVVATVAPDSAIDGRLQRVKSDVRIPGATAALRAAAEAAEDVLKDRYSETVFDRNSESVFDRHSESVFDRLGRRTLLTATEEPFDFREQDQEDGEYKHIDNPRAEKHVEYHGRDQYVAGDTYMYHRETEKAADTSSDTDQYDDTDAVRYNNGVNPYRSTLPSTGGKESLVAGYNTAEGAAGVRSRKSIAQDTHASSGPRTSEKILNISANNNTRTPPNHETSRNAARFEHQVPMGKKDVGSRKAIATIPHAKDTHMTDNSKDSVNSSSLADAPKTSSVAATGQPESSPDSRTVFVSNVHFGATKDALSRHFNKFGAVLKTLIVSDGVTGQPTGSAYIEFLEKDSAEQALTLNGTSFMSRILKVVRRSSVEVPQLPGWSRGARASPFASRLIRTAYPRPTFPGAIRGRLGLRGNARNFQWKREATDSVDAGKPSQATPLTPGRQTLTPMMRSFTYTRTEPKQDVGATANI